MKDFIFTFSLFSSALFFSITAILGIGYDNTSSGLYMYYCIISFVITFLTFLLVYSKQHKYKEHNVLFIVAFIYILVGIVSGFFTDKSVLCFGAFCLPAICIGIYYANYGQIGDMVKWLDVVMWIMTAAMFFLLRNLSVSMLEGVSYYSQELSYHAALCFLLDLFLLSYGSNYKRFALFNNKIIRILNIVLLLAYPVAILYSGGRGGFVAIFVGVLIYAFTSGHKKVKSNIVVGILLIVLGFGFASLITKSGSADFMGNLQRNGERVFAYITKEGIDMSETSGRDKVYAKTLNLVGQNPLGYGLFSYKTVLQKETKQPYPHNLFLEWMIQGGILLFLFYSYILFFILRKYHRTRKAGRASPLLIPFMVYSLVLLCFSGSYMEEPFFWFTLSYIYCIRNSKSKHAIVLDNTNMVYSSN